MNKQITSVFYSSDLLPYKDSARTIHYPLTAGTFAGSHNTKEVRFYVRDIGGTNGISWVVVSKLPNGKIGYEVCSNVQTDSELGEQYLSFDLSAYYTQVKGDLYIALRGYQGQITFEDDDSDGVYNISGDPLIEVTGTIKLSINYSPMVNTGTQVLPTDIDRIISALSNYLEIANGIIVARDISGETPSDYNTNQIFFEYKNDLGTFYYVKETSGVKSFSEITFDSLRTEELRVSNYILLTNEARLYYDDSKLKMTVNGHTFALSTSGVVTIDNNELATQDYVDSEIQTLEDQIQIVDYENPYYNLVSLVDGGTITINHADISDIETILTNNPRALFRYVWYSSGIGYHYYYFHLDGYNDITQLGLPITHYYTCVKNNILYSMSFEQNGNMIITKVGEISTDSYFELSGGISSGTLSTIQLAKAKKTNAIIKHGNTYFVYASQNDTQITFHRFYLASIVSNLYGIYDDKIVVTKSSGAWSYQANGSTFYNKNGVDNAIANLGTVLRYKSSAYVAQLNAMSSSSFTAGDVYNVIDSGTLTAGNISVNAGDNVVWTSNNTWDKLAGTIDLSGYVQKTQTIAGIDLQDNITSQELSDALTYATNTDIDNLF